jgi:hypothetical protein
VSPNGNVSPYYPPSWLGAVLSPYDAYDLFVLLHLVLGALGVYVLGRTFDIRPVASWVGGLLAFTAAFWIHWSTHLVHVAGMVWMPWLLAAVWWLVTGPSLRRTAVLAAVAGLLVALTLLVLIGVGIVRLESPLGVLRDGLQPGERAPRWALRDLDGVERRSPSSRWQLLVFGDHSLREFGGFAEALNRLQENSPELEIVLLSRGHPDLTDYILRQVLDLRVPIVHVDEAFYRRYDVRVMPFLYFIDPGGVIRAPAIVNQERTLLRMWQLAQARTAEAGGASRRTVAA